MGRVPVEVRESGKGPGRGQGEWEGSEIKRRAVVTAPFSPAGLGFSDLLSTSQSPKGREVKGRLKG